MRCAVLCCAVLCCAVPFLDGAFIIFPHRAVGKEIKCFGSKPSRLPAFLGVVESEARATP